MVCFFFFHHVFSCSSTQAYRRFLDWFPISPRYSVIWQLSSTQHFMIWSHSIAYATLKDKKRLGVFFNLFFLQQRFHPQRYVHAVQMKLVLPNVWNHYFFWIQTFFRNVTKNMALLFVCRHTSCVIRQLPQPIGPELSVAQITDFWRCDPLLKNS